MDHELDEYVNNLKCCGNCSALLLKKKCLFFDTSKPGLWKGYCRAWEFDNLTQEKRMLE